MLTSAPWGWSRNNIARDSQSITIHHIITSKPFFKGNSTHSFPLFLFCPNFLSYNLLAWGLQGRLGRLIACWITNTRALASQIFIMETPGQNDCVDTKLETHPPLMFIAFLLLSSKLRGFLYMCPHSEKIYSFDLPTCDKVHTPIQCVDSFGWRI